MIMLSAHTHLTFAWEKKTLQDKDALCALGERKTTFVFKVREMMFLSCLISEIQRAV